MPKCLFCVLSVDSQKAFGGEFGFADAHFLQLHSILIRYVQLHLAVSLISTVVALLQTYN